MTWFLSLLALVGLAAAKHEQARRSAREQWVPVRIRRDDVHARRR